MQPLYLKLFVQNKIINYWKAADTHHVYSSHKRLSLKQKRLAQ